MKFLLTFLFFASVLFAQNNVTLLSNLNQYPSAGYNDIWGYVDGSGNEYALLGVQTGTSIINVTNPTTPVQVAFIPGPNSTWRDIKVHSTYAYIITEGTGTGRGLQIVDLSQLPTTATLVNTIETWFTRAHNIYIDNGFAYVIGTNNGGGMHILDLSNPVNPTRTFYYTGSNYIHDVYVWNDTVVAAAEDSYDLINVSNKFTPQLLSVSMSLPGIYAHSGWMTEDKRYFVGTEEFNVRDITVWDITDRSSWNLTVPTWQMPGSTSYVHNLFILGNYAHISYYTSGYVVLDISDPANPQLAGHYDTYPSNNGGTYNGAWGCYPYLPSGNTLISDISTGLYVLKFNGSIPVELSSFTAEVISGNVNLKWTTSTEKNNQGFEVQRKQDNEFYTIGFVEGNGTTTEINDYIFTDRNVGSGNYYYRLKQIDFDGSTEYSDEIFIEVSAPSEFVLNQNYPNPFNPATNVKFSIPTDEFVNLSIYNLVGEKVAELINEALQQGEHNLNFNASGLPSGIYIAKLSAGSFSQSIKMTLLK
ncbi:MAG TPA: choice-of-anchor B family protein [Ignavibacteriaceae bacterium]